MAPTVTGISPASGSAGTSVTITGTAFTGTPTVSFGGNAATNVNRTSGTQITCTAPSGTGTVDVEVTTTGGTSVANPPYDQFTYQGVPTVTGVSPNSGYTVGGGTVTVTGTNFAGATAVKFGTLTGIIGSNNGTQILATIPQSTATGTVDITVVTGGGTSATSAADQFTYASMTGAVSTTYRFYGYGPGTGMGQYNIGANDGVNYFYWFTDSGHTTPLAVSHALGTSGDTIYWDSGAATLTGALSWSGVTFAGGSVSLAGNYQFTLDSACVIASGVSFGQYGSPMTVLSTAAKWLGNVSISGIFSVILYAGWRCNNGAAGGSISVTGGNYITVDAPAGGQASLNTITLTVYGGTVNLSGISNISLTGTATLTAISGSLITPSGTWITLVGNGANAYGVTMGHVPAVANVLPSDNVFGVTGTAPATEMLNMGG
jgi:hypothetical protein